MTLLDDSRTTTVRPVLPNAFPAAMTPMDEPVHGHLVPAAPGCVLPGDLVLYAEGSQDLWLRVGDVNPGALTTANGYPLQGDWVWVWTAADVLEAISRGELRMVKCGASGCGEQTLLESVVPGWFCGPKCEADS